MAVKNELLALLEASRGKVISGQELAQRLGVSRAAVWKAATALRAQGVAVSAAPGSGYSLLPESDFLSQEAAETYFAPPKAPVRVLQEASSTNLLAKQWAIEGAPHGSVVVAERQTQGRGRLGRSFASPPGGLYLSVVLRPQRAVGNPVLITAAAAVAVCRAVQALCGIELSIKWVNDLFLKGKKCCGILTEAGTGFENGSIEYIVVGIGINYRTRPEEFAPEIRQIATALYPGGAAQLPRLQLAAAIYENLLGAFERLESKEFLPEYRARSLALGREVTVLAQPPYTATALAIDDEARLVVKKQSGETAVLSAGEISIRL